MKDALPPPDEDQLAASRALARRLSEAIGAAGGWLRFDEWMRRTLYEPGLGYYSGGSRKFGAEGDFVTAPEISPLFGECVAAQCAQWFDEGVEPAVFEFGAGSGALAAQVLARLEALGFPGVEYRIVELSGELRERQRETIAARAPRAAAPVRWLDALPERIDGVVLGNELLDAMPVRLFRLEGEAVLERGVTLSQGAFALADRPADAAFEAAVRAALDRSGWAAHGGWPDGYCSELGEQAAAWTGSVASRIGRGAMLLLDYGFPRAEYYHPQRAQGTLMCHYRHRAHADPLWLPGLQDVTAHVDFGAVRDAALAGGLELLGYASQANFLLNCGLLESFARTSGGDAIEQARASRAVQKLVSEAEMGELFKAIAFGRGVGGDALGFRRRDRSASLG